MKKIFSAVSLVCFMGLLLFGCDEGMNIVKPVMTEESEVSAEQPETPETPEQESPTETTEQPEDPITTIGKMKQPEESETEEMEGQETSDPEVEPEPEEQEPEVIEISCYRDENFTTPLVGSVGAGATIYSKVVFSGSFPVVFPESERRLWEQRPGIVSRLYSSPEESRSILYRLRPRNTELQSGEVKQYQNTEDTFICKYVVQIKDEGKTFFTYYEDSEITNDPLHIIFFSYTPEDSSEYEPIVQQSPNDFIGTVLIPNPREHTPVYGAMLTIMSGTRSGEYVTTEKNGQYVFRNVAENELHLRVEKEYFEPKEVIVYRDRQTALANGDRADFQRRSKEPGTIYVGLRWPDEIRTILQQITVVTDLLYFETALREETAGTFALNFGVISIDNNKSNVIEKGILHVLAHEVAHAWQVAQVNSTGSLIWEDSPSGKAFAEAQEKDWEEKGKLGYYDSGYFISDLLENAAEVSSLFWSIDQEWESNFARTLKENAPNRFKWCVEWIGLK